MGNTPSSCAIGVGGEAKKVRVLLPDGTIVRLDGPVEAADLMLEHINHMVMQCSTLGSGAKGERTDMTILQPHEKLQPGQAYVVHPIPSPSNRKTKLRSQRITDSVQKNQEQAKPLSQVKQQSLQRYRSRVADSSQSENAAQTPERKSTSGGSPGRFFTDESESRELQKDLKHHVKDEGENEGEDERDVLLNLKMYMGWRPALESIPESPGGYQHHKNVMQQPPLLCV